MQGAGRATRTDDEQTGEDADPARPTNRGSPWWQTPLLVIVGTLAVRLAVIAGGNRFSTYYVDRYSMWQLIDPVLLRRDPLAPVWDMHTQPPLFNVFVGSVLRWSPLSDALSFQLLFTLAGVAGAVAVAQVLRICGCRWWVAGLAAVVVFSDPVLIGYEMAVSHEPLVTPLLACATWGVASYARTPSQGRFAAFVGCATALVLLRPLFHPLWLALAVAVVLLMRPPAGGWRRVAPVLAIPLVVVGVLIVKNQVRFGEASLSSWSGMNLARTTVAMLDDDVRADLIASGALSEQAKIGPFAPYSALAPYAGPCESDFGTPILDATRKSDGIPNFNAACFVPVYQQARHDAQAMVRHEPGTYLAAVRANATLFVSDPKDPGHQALLGWPAGGLARLHRVIDMEVTVTATYPPGWWIDADVQLTLVVAIGALVVLGARSARRRWRGGVDAVDVVLAFVGLTVAVMTAASVLFDALETSRFRAPLDPLVFGAVVGFMLEAGTRAIQARDRGDVAT